MRSFSKWLVNLIDFFIHTFGNLNVYFIEKIKEKFYFDMNLGFFLFYYK